MKNVKLMLMLFLSGMVLFSCSKDEDDGDGFGDLPYSAVYDGVIGPEFTTPSKKFTITFKDDGTLTVSGSEDTNMIPNGSGTHTSPTAKFVEMQLNGIVYNCSFTFNESFTTAAGSSFFESENYVIELKRR